MYRDYLHGLGRHWVPKGIVKIKTSSFEGDSSSKYCKSRRAGSNAPDNGSNMSEQARQVHEIEGQGR